MNSIGGWFRQLGARLSTGFRHFMTGRYGTDKLNMYILGGGVVICLISMFVSVPLVNLLLTIISYGLMIWALFRTFSRNTYKRYQENRKFLLFLDHLKDRDHKYFNCPKCHQPVRVPKGKGKIAITCPKCREVFVRKS